MRDGRPTSPRFATGFSPVFGESAASIPNGEVKPLPSLTVFFGYAVSNENPNINYRNGDIIHLEGTLQQFLPLGSKITLLGIGAVTLSSNYNAIDIKKGFSNWRRIGIAGRRCRASYETVHHYESIHFDQLDR